MRERWIAAALAAPYLAAVAALHGLTRAMPTFHGGDEANYHLPTIARFAADLPQPDLVHYPAAQTPLFHLFVAAVGKVAGMELWRLRLVTVLASYLAVLALWRLLRRHAPLPALPAAGLAALVGLSPYVFGNAFLLMTDNLALLFAVLALERLVAFARDRRLTPFTAACGWTALAILTRQSYLWLAPLALATLALHRSLDGRQRRVGAGLVALALVPFGALVLAWGGLVPPTADPTSCALCADGRPGLDGGAALRAPLFAIAIAGLYGTLLHWPALAGALRSGDARRRAGPALAAAGGAVLLLLVPLRREGPGDAGWLWRIAETGPTPLGTSWLLWLLVPLGCAVLAGGARRLGGRSLPVLMLGCFLVAQLATRLTYQKYFDPLVLLACLLALRPEQLRTRRDLVGPALVLLLSVAYVAAFASGLIDVES